MADPLLVVEGLVTGFETRGSWIPVVDQVDLHIERGEVFSLVGESGSGKTVTALSIMGLIEPPGSVMAGRLAFDGRSLFGLEDEALAALRGDRLAMIFQDPVERLNPVFSIGTQIAEVLRVHRGLKRSEAWDQAVAWLERVGMPDAGQRAHAYPHELSGGQAQRVMIAMALALTPELIIADEPTTALDVTIQAQILALLGELRDEREMAILLITHNMGVIAGMADRVGVLYAGEIIEQAPVDRIFHRALHPYTQGLIASIPNLETNPDRLPTIPGKVPEPGRWPAACRFAPRCGARVEYGLTICEQRRPDLRTHAPGHEARCWLYQDAPGHQAPLKGEAM